MNRVFCGEDVYIYKFNVLAKKLFTVKLTHTQTNEKIKGRTTNNFFFPPNVRFQTNFMQRICIVSILLKIQLLCIPFSGPHDVVVQLLVEVVEERDCLNDHGVDLVRAELQLVARQRVGKTQRHCSHFFVLMRKEKF